VAHPRDEDDLEAVLDWALQAGAAVIPFGGDTSVVGGVEPVVPEHFAGVVTIDMQALDRVLEVDRAAPGCSRPSAGGRHRWGWREAFLRARYLRDTFVAMGVLSETLETSITWDRFDRLHAAVLERVGAGVRDACGQGSITCRFTRPTRSSAMEARSPITTRSDAIIGVPSASQLASGG